MTPTDQSPTEQTAEVSEVSAVSAAAVDQAAQRLLQARRDSSPCPPVRDLIGSADVELAYAVQERVTAARTAQGARVVGHKIGLTSPVVQAQLGVDQPDFGVLFDDMGFVDGDVLPMDRLLQPKVEAEIAFGLSADLAEGSLDADQVRDAVEFAVAALEIVDSRVAGWDISFADTVADNASSGLYVLGTERCSLADLDPVTVEMQMTVEGEVVSTGDGAACLGDPLLALAWLARTARELGQPLRAGQVVLSGALGPMHPVAAGDHVVAELSGLGTVATSFSKEGS